MVVEGDDVVVGVAGVVDHVEVLHERGAENKSILAIDLLFDNTEMACFLISLAVDIVEQDALGRDLKSDGVSIVLAKAAVKRESEFERRHLVLNLITWVEEVAPFIALASHELVSVGIAQIIFESFKCGLWQRDVRIARVDESVLVSPDIISMEASAVELDDKSFLV